MPIAIQTADVGNHSMLPPYRRLEFHLLGRVKAIPQDGDLALPLWISLTPHGRHCIRVGKQAISLAEENVLHEFVIRVGPTPIAEWIIYDRILEIRDPWKTEPSLEPYSSDM